MRRVTGLAAALPHIHLDGTARSLAVIVIVVLAAVVLVSRRSRPVTTASQAGGSLLPLATISALIVAVWFALRYQAAAVAARPAAAPAPRAALPAPRPAVTHTVVRQAAAHPLLSGWQIVAIVAVTLVIAMVIVLNMRSEG